VTEDDRNDVSDDITEIVGLMNRLNGHAHRLDPPLLRMQDLTERARQLVVRLQERYETLLRKENDGAQV
jgi:hypothetical protein